MIRRPVALAALLSCGSAAAQAASAKSEAGASLTIAVSAPEREAEQDKAIAHGQDDSDDAAPEGDEVGTAAAGAGFRGTFGRVFTRGVSDGWFGRLELEAYTATGVFEAGPTAGALVGGEIWTAEDAAGGGLPMSVYFGVRSPVVISQLGLGFNLFVYDEVDDDGGFGIYTPFGFLAMGVEAGGFRVMADARVTYRWQWGADDRGQLALGLSVAHVFESRTRKRRVEAKPPLAQ